MSEHIYGYIRADLFPMNRLDEIKRILNYSNMPNWNFKRKEAETDLEGIWYVGLEEEQELNEEQRILANQIGITIIGNSIKFIEWLNEYGNFDDDIVS